MFNLVDNCRSVVKVPPNTGTAHGVCASERVALALKSGISLGVATTKIKLAAASLASIPVTGPVGVAGAAYGIIGGVGNGTAGIVQVGGAIWGNTGTASNAANVLTTVTTLGGLITLIATKGDMQAASNAAAFESLGTAGLNGGATGHLIDHSATLVQKFLLGVDLAQTAADATGIPTDGSCGP